MLSPEAGPAPPMTEWQCINGGKPSFPTEHYLRLLPLPILESLLSPTKVNWQAPQLLATVRERDDRLKIKVEIQTQDLDSQC